MLGQLADGTPVFDRPDSHLSGHEEARPWLPKAFAQVKLSDFEQGTWAGVCELGEFLGWSTCVPVSLQDEVIYAVRRGRTGWTRFVRNRKGEPCTSLKMVLRWSPDQEVVLLRTAFIGRNSPPEPWSSGAAESPEALQNSRDFWARHALIWDDSVIDRFYPVATSAPPDYWGTEGEISRRLQNRYRPS